MIPTKAFLTESNLVKNEISNYWKKQKSNKILEISEIAIPNFVGKKRTEYGLQTILQLYEFPFYRFIHSERECMQHSRVESNSAVSVQPNDHPGVIFRFP